MVFASVHAFVNVDLRIRPTFTAEHIYSQKSDDERKIEREQAIIEAGGDPFFLPDDTDENVEEMVEEEEVSMPSLTLMGMSAMAGGVVDEIVSGDEENKIEEEKTDPGWVWDGEYDEDAYFDS